MVTKHGFSFFKFHFVLVFRCYWLMFAYAVLVLISSALSHDTGWEEHLRNEWDEILNCVTHSGFCVFCWWPVCLCHSSVSVSCVCSLVNSSLLLASSLK